MTSCDLAIVGAGPAGAAAAIQARRQGLRVLLFERDAIGGAARSANWIENLPGYPRGIAGIAFARKLADQLARHRVRVVRREATGVCRRNGHFEIAAGERTFTARAVIVACGLEGRRLGLPGETALAHRILPYPVPSRTPHAGRRVIVVGGGDTAFDQAIGFSRKAASVVVAMRGKKPRAIPRLVAAARKHGVVVRTQHQPIAVKKSNSALAMTFSAGKEQKTIDADLVALCIGKKPRARLWLGKNRSTAGLAFAGDCCTRNARHVAIAAGDGIAKAMAAAAYLAHLERNR
jgi:thioredoxin reductase (NADPH)